MGTSIEAKNRTPENNQKLKVLEKNLVKLKLVSTPKLGILGLLQRILPYRFVISPKITPKIFNLEDIMVRNSVSDTIRSARRIS